MALVDAGRWTMTKMIDVRLALGPPSRGATRLPEETTLHIGSARTLARVRPLGPPVPAAGTAIARLTLRDALPLHVGDRVLLRDPGRSDARILGATVLDVAPPAVARRGAAAAAGRELAAWPDLPSAADLLRRHGLLRAGALAAMGVTAGPDPMASAASVAPVSSVAPVTPVIGDWLTDPVRWADLRRRLAEVVAAHARSDPLAIGMSPEAARAALGVPDRTLLEALARPPLDLPAGAGGPAQVQLTGGYLRLVAQESPERQAPRELTGPASSLPPRVVSGIRAVLADLARAPFIAPEAGRLEDLGLDQRALAAAARAGLLLRVSEQIVLAPGADAEAALLLARLPQPFTTAEARQALGTTRRVAIPLLEYLDRARITHRLPDDRRRTR
jgi:selenocysteine-specific elongation factor